MTTRNQEYRSVDGSSNGSFLFATRQFQLFLSYYFAWKDPNIQNNYLIQSTPGELYNEEFLFPVLVSETNFLEYVFFETNSAVLKEIGKQELQIVANWMVTVEDTVIFELQGTRITRGSEAWNLTLSQQRAMQCVTTLFRLVF